MSTAKGTWKRDGGLINPKEKGVSRIMAKRGPKGNYPCKLIQPFSLNFLFVYEPSNF
jgi:hypothetical protein